MSRGQTVLVITEDLLGAARVEVGASAAAANKQSQLVGQESWLPLSPETAQALLDGGASGDRDALPGRCGQLAPKPVSLILDVQHHESTL